ncbi:hypothetical protein CH289_03965 [Rhodococcus sp. RS1C4]|nr:hypothetical protein CH289_03965 [Rhodococcus sp. RS1C4]
MIAAALAVRVVALSALPFVGAFGCRSVMIGLGITLGLPQPMTMAWVVASAGAGSRGSALGLHMTANRPAQVTLPLTISTVASPFGVSAIFLSNAAVLGFSAGLSSQQRSISEDARHYLTADNVHRKHHRLPVRPIHL